VAVDVGAEGQVGEELDGGTPVGQVAHDHHCGDATRGCFGDVLGVPAAGDEALRRQMLQP
jgi:hypothetical protein